jgi:hypothetical protein
MLNLLTFLISSKYLPFISASNNYDGIFHYNFFFYSMSTAVIHRLGWPAEMKTNPQKMVTLQYVLTDTYDMVHLLLTNARCAPAVRDACRTVRAS